MISKKEAVRELIRKGILVSKEQVEKYNPEELLNITKPETPIKIVFSYRDKPQKRNPNDFVAYFNARYKSIEKILLGRQELKNVRSIARINSIPGKENISCIGMVVSKRETQKGNIMLTVEDPTDKINIIISNSKKELFNLAQDIVVDETIGIVGSYSNGFCFANKLFYPDIPVNFELKKGPREVYAIFMSDLHFGSNQFLKKDFDRFISWINGEAGNDNQKQLANKVKYIFIMGDVVDGVGIYPNQNNELAVEDVKEQYSIAAEYFLKIPKDKSIIICPGNHDTVRISEPQPAFNKKYAGPILELENVYAVSNPAMINIESTDDFSGFNVLIYHGYSFDYYVSNVSSIRHGGGYDRADLLMKFMLQRRHLAPAYSSTLAIPDQNRDSLVIDIIPDIFATGHIHRTSVANYKGVTTISGSCWQSITSFQEKLGHIPQASRVPVVNLKTREAKILKFG